MEKTYSTRWVIATALFLTLGALLVSGSYFARSSLVPDEELQIRSIVEEPNKYYSKNVAVSGEIDNLVSDSAFTLDGPANNTELLVISKESLEPIGGAGYQQSIVDEDDTVSIHGVVHQFNLKEMESLLQRDLDDEEFASWEGKPVVIAEKVTPKEK